MATADDYAAWIVKNADKQGTPEFDTVAQAYQSAKGEAHATQPADAFKTTAKSDTNMQNLNSAIGGTLYAPYLGVKSMFGQADPGEVDQWKKSMAGLWSTPMGKVGTVAGGMAAMAPAVMAAGSSVPVAAGLGAAYGLAQPETDWMSRAKNALVGLVGSGGGQAVGNALATKAAASASLPKILTPAEQTADEAVKAGYKIAPNEAGQQSALQWVGGQIKTQQTMASKNVPNTTRLAAQEVGLPADEPITRASLQGVRDAAGQAYDAVKNAQPTIPTDPTMQALAQHIENSYNRVTQSFKSLKNPEIETLVQDLKNPAFDSEGLVEAVKQFRSEGNANIASAKPSERALGRVQLQAQDALESLIDRTLTAAGQPDAVSALQAARQTIAKTYSIQGALDANGNVIAANLAKQAANGKPLSGNLATIAQTAAAFPKSTQHFTATPPAFSPLDMMAALLTHGKEAVMLGARPVARAVMASDPYQKAFMQPGSGALPGLLSSAANNPYMKLLEATAPSSLLSSGLLRQ